VHGEREAAHHISIGRFAGLTGISANTLRRCDEAGLLSPAFADPLTGYRPYSIEQLDDGMSSWIASLRASMRPSRKSAACCRTSASSSSSGHNAW
jgi:hypothetical protein